MRRCLKSNATKGIFGSDHALFLKGKVWESGGTLFRGPVAEAECGLKHCAVVFG